MEEGDDVSYRANHIVGGWPFRATGKEPTREPCRVTLAAPERVGFSSARFGEHLSEHISSLCSLAHIR